MERRAPVAQLDRVSASEAEGHRFESCRVRQQLSRSKFAKVGVEGSNPFARSSNFKYFTEGKGAYPPLLFSLG